MPVSEIKTIIQEYKIGRKKIVLNELQQLDMLDPSNTSPEKVGHLVVMWT
jgi:hypothetical protein